MCAKKKEKFYAVVDIETTGGMSNRDRITEIAIIVTNGRSVIKSFTSLINPERSIPPEITRITGITNDMVRDAPKFYEVAKEIVEHTTDCIFVAHNVSFDYNFIRNEFASLGYTYTKRQLCTVKLSRKTFPGLKSYALGNLIKHFGIEVNARHRAFDDAYATTELLGRILSLENAEETATDIVNKGLKESKLPEGISLEKLHSLPETPGVYYMLNAYSRIIYIGKSINIKARMMQHFGAGTRKAERMLAQVAEIDCVETGHELLAIIHESYEIKKHLPEINKIQRTSDYPFAVSQFIDDDGYLNFVAHKSSDKKFPQQNILSYFGSIASAKGAISNLRAEFVLCESKIGATSKGKLPCIYRSMSECLGACTGEESAEDYNLRAQLAISSIDRIFEKDFFIVTAGRNTDEKGLILIENGLCQGFGYISVENMSYGIEEMKEAIDYKTPNFELNRLIRSYLATKNDFKILPI